MFGAGTDIRAKQGFHGGTEKRVDIAWGNGAGSWGGFNQFMFTPRLAFTAALRPFPLETCGSSLPATDQAGVSFAALITASPP